MALVEEGQCIGVPSGALLVVDGQPAATRGVNVLAGASRCNRLESTARGDGRGCGARRSCGLSAEERGDSSARPGVALGRTRQWRVQVQAAVASRGGTATRWLPSSWRLMATPSRGGGHANGGRSKLADAGRSDTAARARGRLIRHHWWRSGLGRSWGSRRAESGSHLSLFSL
ncbi:splicing factor PWI domain-containing protein isoform X1 [Iris pallida]|uniref:Splicing factor PWI domain-containing protein isoform X1 n=1 Tax=Iris pallida TaxID=29817 RepID=A0AAX6FY08_IRIPA|nr:splicing factor PWI domain-containing protein isoform X1 [Iris pallida]